MRIRILSGSKNLGGFSDLDCHAPKKDPLPSGEPGYEHALTHVGAGLDHSPFPTQLAVGSPSIRNPLSHAYVTYSPTLLKICVNNIFVVSNFPANYRSHDKSLKFPLYHTKGEPWNSLMKAAAKTIQKLPHPSIRRNIVWHQNFIKHIKQKQV